eukprot:scaffold11875_cov132-Isochrysis_galbana.AAC.9
MVEAMRVCSWRGTAVLLMCKLSEDGFGCGCCRSCVGCKGELAAQGSPTETTPGTRAHRVGCGARPSEDPTSKGSLKPEIRHAGCSAVTIPKARCGAGAREAFPMCSAPRVLRLRLAEKARQRKSFWARIAPTFALTELLEAPTHCGTLVTSAAPSKRAADNGLLIRMSSSPANTLAVSAGGGRRCGGSTPAARAASALHAAVASSALGADASLATAHPINPGIGATIVAAAPPSARRSTAATLAAACRVGHWHCFARWGDTKGGIGLRVAQGGRVGPAVRRRTARAGEGLVGVQRARDGEVALVPGFNVWRGGGGWKEGVRGGGEQGNGGGREPVRERERAANDFRSVQRLWRACYSGRPSVPDRWYRSRPLLSAPSRSQRGAWRAARARQGQASVPPSAGSSPHLATTTPSPWFLEAPCF